MTIRILADREPYSSYADSLGPLLGSLVISCGPAGLDDPEPDILVLPAEDFLSLRGSAAPESGCGTLYIPYGPVALMGKAFESGCSDYIREPWALPELRARACRFEKLRFRIGARGFEMRGDRLSSQTASSCLNEVEKALLRLLVLNAPYPVPREAFFPTLVHLARRGSPALGRRIRSLRSKLESVEPGLGRRLHAIRGFGYRLEVTSCG